MFVPTFFFMYLKYKRKVRYIFFMIRKFEKKNWFYSYDIIFDLELSEHSKITYLYLCRCADNDSKSFPSYSTIAKKCSFSRSTAIRAIKELEEIKLLYKQERLKSIKGKTCNTSNLYYVFPEPYETTDIQEIEEEENIIVVPKNDIWGSVTQTLGVVSHIHHPSITQTPKGLHKEVQHINKDNDVANAQINQSFINQFYNLWANITGKKIKLTSKQLNVLGKIIEQYGEETVLAAIEKIKDSDYLIANIKPSKFLDENTFIKIFNGEYDNRTNTVKTNEVVSKNIHFTTTYSHNWDMEELERRNRELLEEKYLSDNLMG